MTRRFTVSDHHHGRPITATIVVDTLIDEHDMFYIKTITDEKGIDMYISEPLRQQLSAVFIMEHGEEYDRMLEEEEKGIGKTGNREDG